MCMYTDTHIGINTCVRQESVASLHSTKHSSKHSSKHSTKHEHSTKHSTKPIPPGCQVSPGVPSQGRTGIECHESECHADGHGASVLCRLTGCIPVVTRSYLYSQSNPPELACATTPWLHLWLSSDQLQWTPCPCVSSQSSSQTFPQHMLLLMQTSTMGDTERERFSATEGHVVLVLLFRESQSGHVCGRGSAWHAPPMWRSHSTTYTSQSYAAM